MVYTFFDKKSSGGVVKRENMLNQRSAEELHKPIIRKFENWKERIQKLIKKQDIIRKFEKRKEIIQKLKETGGGFTMHLLKQTR